MKLEFHIKFEDQFKDQLASRSTLNTQRAGAILALQVWYVGSQILLQSNLNSNSQFQS